MIAAQGTNSEGPHGNATTLFVASARTARRRRVLLVQWALWLCLAGAAPGAWAASPYALYGSQMYAQEKGQRGQPPGRPSRDREESQRRQGERERNNSMTPDERRELNRDLQRANREFYRKGREGR